MGYAKKNLWRPKPEDYEKFRDAIQYDFENKFESGKIKNEEELAELMQLSGYHRTMKGKKKGQMPDKLQPTQRQLTLAWKILKGQITIKKDYYIITDNKGNKKYIAIGEYYGKDGKLYTHGKKIPEEGL
jgi:hypothetical protein